MNFPQPLAHGQLVARYKRFFADVVLDDGTAITAHCPNPGAMLGVNTPGLGVWLSRSDDPKRKLAWTLELVEADGALVGINTLLPNRLVAEALAADAIAELTGYDVHRREVKYGEASRVDFLLEKGTGARCWLEVKNSTANKDDPFTSERRHWVEVKNCNFSRKPGLAEFPDCVAARSARHMDELANMVRQGDDATVLFVIQRTDCNAFTAASDLDPVFSASLERAVNAGVNVLCYACDLGVRAVRIAHRVEWLR